MLCRGRKILLKSDLNKEQTYDRIDIQYLYNFNDIVTPVCKIERPVYHIACRKDEYRPQILSNSELQLTACVLDFFFPFWVLYIKYRIFDTHNC